MVFLGAKGRKAERQKVEGRKQKAKVGGIKSRSLYDCCGFVL